MVALLQKCLEQPDLTVGLQAFSSLTQLISSRRDPDAKEYCLSCNILLSVYTASILQDFTYCHDIQMVTPEAAQSFFLGMP